MKKLITAIKWDTLLIYRYGIIAIAAIITLIYSLAFTFIDTSGLEKLVTILVFSDPVMYGFLFTAAMILFEKESNTHEALAVSPLTPTQYILSKAITFTLLALICSIAIIMAAHPNYFQPIIFISGVILSALLFVFIGIIGVAFVNSFNQFILLMPIVLGPTCLPFLNFFGLANSPIFYIIPTQASLVLFKASVVPTGITDLIYAFTYLLIWNFISYKLAIRIYKQRILKITPNE